MHHGSALAIDIRFLVSKFRVTRCYSTLSSGLFIEDQQATIMQWSDVSRFHLHICPFISILDTKEPPSLARSCRVAALLMAIFISPDSVSNTGMEE